MSTWTHVITLSAQDVPLYSNYELRYFIEHELNGKNDIEIIDDSAHEHRYNMVHMFDLNYN